MNSFDFTTVFQKASRLFIRELQALMNMQRGVDGSAYAPLRPETIAQKRLISTATANKRMIRTKDFINNAFESESSANNLRVFVSPKLHGRDLRNAKKASTKKRLASAAIPHNKLAEYQLATGNSNFFPQGEEAEKMASFAKTKDMIFQEAMKQARENMTLKMTVDLHVG